jgi:hypothetical protein
MRRRTTIALTALALLFAAAWTIRMYSIRAVDNEAKLLWNDREAFIFVGMSELGMRETSAQLATEAVYNLLGAVRGTDDTRRSVLAIHYTSSGLEKHLLPDVQISEYIGFGNHVYNLRGERWSGARFEKATGEESERLHAEMRGRDLTHPADGWSYRMGVLHGPELEAHFPMYIGGESIELVVQRYGRNRSIQLRRPNQPPQELWHLDEQRKWVDKQEYERHFPR